MVPALTNSTPRQWFRPRLPRRFWKVARLLCRFNAPSGGCGYRIADEHPIRDRDSLSCPLPESALRPRLGFWATHCCASPRTGSRVHGSGRDAFQGRRDEPHRFGGGTGWSPVLHYRRTWRPVGTVPTDLCWQPGLRAFGRSGGGCKRSPGAATAIRSRPWTSDCELAGLGLVAVGINRSAAGPGRSDCAGIATGGHLGREGLGRGEF